MDELTDDVCSALHRTLRTGRDTASASRGRGSQRSAPAHLVCAITLTRDRAQPASRARRPAPEPGGSRGPHSQHAYPPGGLGRAARGDPAQPRRPSPVASPALSPGGAAAPPPRCRRPSTPRPRSRCSRTRAHTARRTREEGGQQYGQRGSSYAPSAGPSASAHPPPARPLPCRARPHRPPLPRPTAFGRRSRPGTLRHWDSPWSVRNKAFQDEASAAAGSSVWAIHGQPGRHLSGHGAKGGWSARLR